MQLLIYLLHVKGAKQETRLMEFLAATQIDWHFFIKLVVMRHRVVGPVYKNLTQYAAGTVPDFVLKSLQKQHHINSCDLLNKVAELFKLTYLFETNGIRALPFKGPVLGVQLYDNLSMRQFSDLDIVIAQEDFFHAERILISSGYKKIQPQYELSKKQYKAFSRQSAHFIFLNPKGNVRVELHWKFFLEHTASVNFDDMWQNREMVKIGGKNIPASPLDLMLIPLLVHGAKHYWQRLFWLNDVFLILKDYTARDWERLIEKIQKLNIIRPALSSIILVNELFDVALPDKIRTMVAHDKKIIFFVKMFVSIQRRKKIGSNLFFTRQGFCVKN